MSTAGLVAFNLLVNGLGSFAVAWVLAHGALRLFRCGPGRAHVALLALPFVKLAVDLARGVPAESFLWLRARDVPQDLGSFNLGVGVSWVVPRLTLALGALSEGRQYTQSAPDLLAAVLVKRVSPWAPALIAAVLLAVGVVRLVLRGLGWRRAALERRAVSRAAVLIGRRRVGFRRVDIFVSEALAGSPFTGGVLAPYVCFPKRVWDALRPEERRAALAHELAHVAEHHVLLAVLAGIVRDVFWFVPFIGAAEHRLREACELAADARAVVRSSPPEVLASALVRAREAIVFPAPLRAGTLAANEISLLARVTRLLDAPPPPRLGFGHPVLRVLLTVWVASAVLIAVGLGNH